MGLGKCVLNTTLVFVNGSLRKAEDIWKRHARKPAFDGEGYWANSPKPLLINSRFAQNLDSLPNLG
jgi:hypothetical protein